MITEKYPNIARYLVRCKVACWSRRTDLYEGTDWFLQVAWNSVSFSLNVSHVPLHLNWLLAWELMVPDILAIRGRHAKWFPQSLTYIKSMIPDNLKSSSLCASSSVQFSSVVQSCPTLWDPMNRSTPGLPVHHQLPEFMCFSKHYVMESARTLKPGCGS